MKIQVISDIHLEFRENQKIISLLKPRANILIIAGDLCPIGTKDCIPLLINFFKYVSENFQKIYYVFGNHEFYTTPQQRTTMQEVIKIINSQIINKFQFNNIKILLNQSENIIYRKKQFKIIGLLLWTQINQKDKKKLYENHNDYSCIYINDKKLKNNRRLTPDDINFMNYKSKLFLNKELKKAEEEKTQCIVISHHKPYISGNTNDILNQVYETDMNNFIKPPIICWIYGHTHIHDNTKKNNIKIFSNPVGYPYQRNVGHVLNMIVNI